MSHDPREQPVPEEEKKPVMICAEWADCVRGECAEHEVHSADYACDDTCQMPGGAAVCIPVEQALLNLKEQRDCVAAKRNELHKELLEARNRIAALEGSVEVERLRAAKALHGRAARLWDGVRGSAPTEVSPPKDPAPPEGRGDEPRALDRLRRENRALKDDLIRRRGQVQTLENDLAAHRDMVAYLQTRIEEGAGGEAASKRIEALERDLDRVRRLADDRRGRLREQGDRLDAERRAHRALAESVLELQRMRKALDESGSN